MQKPEPLLKIKIMRQRTEEEKILFTGLNSRCVAAKTRAGLQEKWEKRMPNHGHTIGYDLWLTAFISFSKECVFFNS